MTRVIDRFINEGWTQEVPSGTVNGSNVTFTLANTPDDPVGVALYLDSILLRRTTDYTISGATITMVAAPVAGQDLYAVYTKKL